MLGGFLMGGLLGSLLFGGMHGLTGPGLLDILLVGGLIFFLVRFLRARRMAAETAGQAPFSAAFQDAHPQDGLGSSGYASPPQPFPSAPAPQFPPGFDQKEFLKGAKAIYTRLQRSWDKRDLEDIRQFTATEVYEEIVRQAEADPQPSKTEILRVNAKVLEVRSEGHETVASVLYDVLMRESQDETVARDVSEVWHFRCDETAPGSFWVLEGIQQVEG
jgi:predicted lipid-binding transport protein (Tim44 family)